MRLILALFVIAGAAVPGRAADDKYTSKDGKFAVQFPAGTVVKTDKRKSEFGGESFVTLAAAEGRAFLISYTDLNDEFKKLPAKEFFELDEKLVAKAGHKVESTKALKVGPDELPAREMLIVTRAGSAMRARTVLAGGRSYNVLVAGTKEFVASKEATQFLDSFEVTK